MQSVVLRSLVAAASNATARPHGRRVPRGCIRVILSMLLLAATHAVAAKPTPELGEVMSPDGKIRVIVSLDAEGTPHYAVDREGREVLQPAPLGLVLKEADFSRGLRLREAGAVTTVKDRYELLTGKRRNNQYLASRREFHWIDAKDRRLDIVFQVSNDGVAFRYRLPDADKDIQHLREEATAFRFPKETRGWLQPMSVAKTGFAQTNPSYEEYYLQDVAVGTPTPLGAGWVYPALFRNGDTWVLLSEGSLSRGHAGSRLLDGKVAGEYRVGFPDPRENFQGGPVNPEFPLPWQSPWRMIAIGNLKTIAESTLGTDLADPPGHPPVTPVVPGKASWSWPLMGDDKTVYDVQKRFIDYAADMGWRYTLIDSMWDSQIGYERVRELIDYARSKDVAILLWYNSAGSWNQAHQTPRDRMLTRASRQQEFERLKAMGVAGLKIDFFGGDGQSFINYYLDIMEDAAPYGLLLNFHGATLPRGWQRTYPNLMTMESVRGLEFITFDQHNADQAPTHAAMLPFTRNVFDPMDFTPVVLDKINKIERRTTPAFELAQSVLFVSGIQHYAEIPEGMAKAPDYVRDFLRDVPSIWEDSRYIAGYPGKQAVFARRGDGHWYVAGINAEAQTKSLELDLSELGAVRSGILIADGDGPLSFRREEVRLGEDGKLRIDVPASGGFVLKLE
ncbi:glycoside hydrolase family 97 catalytic domain-containing protein [Pseudoxanthomonas sp. UTMC 1351]|uniref:glycoside hydrolase family 97 protein n=1 Tax=Pseudoxanthomonas sp. UTMC 1351 TaxID=2695853 RepID=UPI0034CF0C3E